jgi:hypothetical protein
MMAQIRKIDFHRVGEQEGCTCDRCGQYIRNIWTVQYADGIAARFGIDCFEKLNKESNLSKFGHKELEKALKRIQDCRERYEAERLLTEETDIRWQNIQNPPEWEDKDYFYGRPWKEYHEWRLNEFFKERFEENQRQIDRFGKVNFAR